MVDNFLRQLCYTIEQEYWRRYLKDYESYGDSASTTRKQWENWQVADDVTKQILDAINASPEENGGEPLFSQLENCGKEITVSHILDKIGNDQLVEWAKGWEWEFFLILGALQSKYGSAQEAPDDETKIQS